MMKRVLALLAALALLLSVSPLTCAEEAAPAETAAAETADQEGDDEAAGELTEQQLAEIEDLDKIDDDEPVYVSGPVYHEMNRDEVNNNTPVIYRARVKDNSSLYSERDVQSSKAWRMLIRPSGRLTDLRDVQA